MTARASAALTVLILAREAAAKGRPELAVSTVTLRTWRHRKHLSPGRGYDLGEILRYIERREAKVA